MPRRRRHSASRRHLWRSRFRSRDRQRPVGSRSLREKLDRTRQINESYVPGTGRIFAPLGPIARRDQGALSVADRRAPDCCRHSPGRHRSRCTFRPAGSGRGCPLSVLTADLRAKPPPDPASASRRAHRPRRSDPLAASATAAVRRRSCWGQRPRPTRPLESWAGGSRRPGPALAAARRSGGPATAGSSRSAAQRTPRHTKQADTVVLHFLQGERDGQPWPRA
jgi:hypothetical protein